MALGVCIPDLIAQGKISAERAAEAQTVYDEMLAQFMRRFGREAAEGMATKKTVEALERASLLKKRRTLLQVKRQSEILYAARQQHGAANGEGLINPQGFIAHLVRDEQANGIANVEYRWHNIKQSALAEMADILNRHRVGLFGEVRNKSDLADLVRARFGETVEDLNTKELADAIGTAFETLRTRANAAGADIGKLNDYGLPQSHDATLVGSVSAEEWIDYILPRLNRTRMIDRDTGLPFSTEKLRLALRDTYEGIVSDGWDDRSPGAAIGKPSIANRHGQERFLHFASADDWMAYNDRFGAGTPYDAIMGHIERMSRDIAMMEILGPNPSATIQWMKDSLSKDVAMHGGLKEREAIGKALGKIDTLWSTISGENRRIGDRQLALFGSTLRNWQVAAKLGGAVISSLSDLTTAAVTRHYNGLPVVKTMSGYLKQLNPADPATRDFARRAGIIGDELTGRIGQQGRMYFDEAFGGRLSGGRQWGMNALEKANELSRRLADGTLRLSGLNAHTLAGREAMGMEFFNAVSTHRELPFDALDPAFRRFFTRYGMDAEAWDKIRASSTVEFKGAQWITPRQISDVALRDRFMEAVLTEIDFAVPTGGLAQRAALNAGLSPGTLMGELVRTGAQFKMFPITVTAMHAQRAMAQQGFRSKAGYAAAFLGATTLTGAIAVQLAEIAKGRDPRDMTKKGFWGQSLLKGGGLGVFGDIVNMSTNEYGQNVGDLLAGPSVATVQDVADLGYALRDQALIAAGHEFDDDAKPRKLGRPIANILTRDTPAASLWYTRAAYERLFVDTVAGWSDPDYHDRYARMERYAKHQGTGYWFAPGQGLSGIRAPDLANAVVRGQAEPAQ